MKYELEIIKELMRECGISHRFNPLIKPSKHPYMKELESYLKINKVNYMYFSQTDSLAVTNINPESVYVSLCHTLMMPSSEGIHVLVHIGHEDYAEDVVQMIEDSLDNMLPRKLHYKIIGVV
jgi:hypothetical protein